MKERRFSRRALEFECENLNRQEEEWSRLEE
jgi:hypothetical protein